MKEKADLWNTRTYQSQISMGVKPKLELLGGIAGLQIKIAKAERKLDARKAKYRKFLIELSVKGLVGLSASRG